ncbi:MAG: cation/acetate symporter [Parvicellaceae bacterium]|jgi:cation/acetate symporter
MGIQGWTYLLVGVTFAIYIGIAIKARATSTKDFFVAGGNISPLANGMATGADWMSAASFLGMAGLIAFSGYDGSAYLMGWTGGYVLLALLLAPYLRKFGKFTVPDFIGDRYYSKNARLLALICAIFISFTYVAGQMRGVGIVFSRFLDVDIELGVVIGMIIVFFYAVLGGMKGITYTQVAQYCVLIFAFTVPAIFISIQMTGNPIPQVGMGGELVNEPGTFLLDKLDLISQDLGLGAYTDGSKSTIDMVCLTAALMLGTAGLPHVIVRFFTVKRIKDARSSAAYALVFIAILYTTAPAIAAFSKTNFIDQISETEYSESPEWFKNWESNGLIAWVDKNNDGVITYYKGDVFAAAKEKPLFIEGVGTHGQRMLSNSLGESKNEVYIDKDIMVLANPEIAGLPDWVIALVAAGALAAALSTAAGLLLVISSSVAHDLIKKQINPKISEKKELLWARIAAGGAVVIAGYFGINPPDYVAAVVAFAFGLAASSFFPAIIMGIFSKRMNKQGVMWGMTVGILFTLGYIVFFKFISPELNNEDYWLFRISPEGIGTIGMILNFIVAIVISKFTPPPPPDVVKIVENIRIPSSRSND